MPNVCACESRRLAAHGDRLWYLRQRWARGGPGHGGNVHGWTRRITIEPGCSARSGPAIAVATDHPIAACMASQYAGWQISVGKFFAMGSGPMRAAGKEALFDSVGHRETAQHVVGVLETRKLPTPDVVAYLAEACQVFPERLTLLAAPTASQAGGVQIVARWSRRRCISSRKLASTSRGWKAATGLLPCRLWQPTTSRPSAARTTRFSTARSDVVGARRRCRFANDRPARAQRFVARSRPAIPARFSSATSGISIASIRTCSVPPW